jgi:hypothetical protein
LYHIPYKRQLKKRAAILLLLLAGIFILAHSFIPHTHHQDHICIINSPCYNQQASNHSGNRHDENRDSHHHNSNENDSRPVAVSHDKGHNHQGAESNADDDQICTKRIRRSSTDPDPDTRQADDQITVEMRSNNRQGDRGETGHPDDNEAECRHSLHRTGGGDDHTHDGHCHTDDCALFEVLVYDPLSRKPVIECPCTENDHNHSELVQAILQAGHKPPESWYNLPFRQKPHIDTYSGYNHSLIPGLRAPPAC